MSKLISILLLPIFLLIASCSTFNLVPQQDIELLLLPPTSESAIQVLKQKITFSKGLKEETFIAISRFSPEEDQILALLPTGQSFLHINYDGVDLNVKNDFSVELPSKDILAIIQFSLRPIQQVKDRYISESGWRFHHTKARRLLSYENTLLLDVHFIDDTTMIKNHQDNYSIEVQTFETEVIKK